MIDNNSLKLLLIQRFLQKCLKPANTAIKSSQKHTYRILPCTMKEMIAVIQLIYNKKVQPVHFYIRELNFSFAKLFNKKTLT
jgi:hypothetical protein